MENNKRKKKVGSGMTIDELAGIIANSFNEMNERFDIVDRRFDAIDERFDRLEFQVSGQAQRLDTLEDRIRQLAVKVGLEFKHS